MPTISPARTVKLMPLTRVDSGAVAHDQVVDLEHRRPGSGRALVDPQQHLAPDHQLGQLLGRGLGGAAVRDHLAAAHHRDVVGHRHDLAQLVRDQHDRAALIAQIAQDPEQMLGFLRGERPGRLIQDQNARAAEQRLQDLDPLLYPDRQLGDAGVEIDLEAVFPLQLRDLVAGAGGALGQREAALGAEQQVLEHRERLDQHEMLVDHADPGPDRVLRAVDLALLALDLDRAPIGLIVAVENVHERRFAGAILADDAVDRAVRDRQVDVPVGVHRAEALVDADQLDRGDARRFPREAARRLGRGVRQRIRPWRWAWQATGSSSSR